MSVLCSKADSWPNVFIHSSLFDKSHLFCIECTFKLRVGNGCDATVVTQRLWRTGFDATVLTQQLWRNGCDAVGRAVASDIRDHRFNSHWWNFFHLYESANCMEKTKMKKKGWEWPFFKTKPSSSRCLKIMILTEVPETEIFTTAFKIARNLAFGRSFKKSDFKLEISSWKY